MRNDRHIATGLYTGHSAWTWALEHSGCDWQFFLTCPMEGPASPEKKLCWWVHLFRVFHGAFSEKGTGGHGAFWDGFISAFPPRPRWLLSSSRSIANDQTWWIKRGEKWWRRPLEFVNDYVTVSGKVQGSVTGMFFKGLTVNQNIVTRQKLWKFNNSSALRQIIIWVKIIPKMWKRNEDLASRNLSPHFFRVSKGTVSPSLSIALETDP